MRLHNPTHALLWEQFARTRLMVVAAFVVHQADPWLMGQAADLFKQGEVDFPKSKEPALVYLIGFATLIFTGAGKFSIDAMIWGRKD